MTKIHQLFTCLFLCLLLACSGSDTYRGNWKAVSDDGNQFDMIFQEDQMIFKMSDTDSTVFNYSQMGISIRGGRSQDIIRLEGGTRYFIQFPVDDDESKGLILDSFGEKRYSINRTNHMPLDEIEMYEFD